MELVINILIVSVAFGAGVAFIGYWLSFCFNKSDGQYWGLGVAVAGFIPVIAGLAWLVMSLLNLT